MWLAVFLFLMFILLITLCIAVFNYLYLLQVYEPVAKSQLKKVQKIWQREQYKTAGAEEASVSICIWTALSHNLKTMYSIMLSPKFIPLFYALIFFYP